MTDRNRIPLKQVEQGSPTKVADHNPSPLTGNATAAAGTAYARWFRNSTPYIRAHRGRTFIVLLGGEALAHPNLRNIVHDLALLHVLGARLVLVHGARPQIDAALADREAEAAFHAHRRITHPEDMNRILGVCGQLASQLEALFSTGLPNTPLHQVEVPVIRGNYVVARPVGIVDGVDHLLTGEIRKVHRERLRATLDGGAVVLLSPFGYSPSGQAFNLAADELAREVAVALRADKLIAFDSQDYARDADGRVLTNLTPTALDHELDHAGNGALTRAHLRALLGAVRGGVRRGHLVSFESDGALLGELFTAEGQGTQISEDDTNSLRAATAQDVSAIVEIIRPLEESGLLVRRSRDRLEQEIDHFFVAELDGVVVGCCALYPYEDSAELACVAVHADYRTARGGGIGARLLQHAEHSARTRHYQRLFALTTQAADWFLEQGFKEGQINDLPGPKQAMYNYQRNSKVMIKPLGGAQGA